MSNGPNFRFGVGTSKVWTGIERATLMLDWCEFGAVWGQSVFSKQWVYKMPM